MIIDRPILLRIIWPRWALFLAAVMGSLTLAAGCGDSQREAQLPQSADEPGKLVTVSVEAIAAPPPPNLIENGDFTKWQAGASAPDYFVAPDSNRGYSSLERDKGASGEESAVKQVWKSSDGLESYTRLFHTWVTGLKPNTAYRFSLRADNPSPNEILVRVFQYNARSPAEAQVSTEAPRVLGSLAVGHTDGFKEFSVTFTTGAETESCILIGDKINVAEGVFPATCIWDDWRLDEAPAQEPKRP